MSSPYVSDTLVDSVHGQSDAPLDAPMAQAGKFAELGVKDIWQWSLQFHPERIK